MRTLKQFEALEISGGTVYFGNQSGVVGLTEQSDSFYLVFDTNEDFFVHYARDVNGLVQATIGSHGDAIPIPYEYNLYKGIVGMFYCDPSRFNF